MALSIHMTDDKVLDDEKVCDLVGELGGQNLETSLELVKRVVTLCNLHVWETLLAEYERTANKE